VGWRVIATAAARPGDNPSLIPVSRIFHSKDAAQDFAAAAKAAGMSDAYIAAVIRPERKELVVK
jgi:hypothetical protein